MRASLGKVATLLLGISVLLAGSGLLGTLLGVRAQAVGIGPAMLGWVMSAFYLGFVVGAWLNPPLIRAVGHIRAFAALASISAAACLLYGLWPQAWVWLLLRFISGVALLGLYMVVESWLNAEGGAHRRGLFSLYMSLSLLALAVGQGLLLFGADQPLAPFALAAVLFSLGVVPIALGRAAQPELPQAPSLALRQLLAAAPAGLFTAAVAGLVTGAFWGLAAPFAQARGLDTPAIAAFMAATVIGGAAWQWPLGRLSDRFDRRHIVAAVAAVGAVAMLLLNTLPADRSGSWWALAFVFGGCAFVLYALAAAQTCDRLPRAQALEATQGLLLVNGLGATFGPALAGLMVQAFGAVAFPWLLAGLLLGLALFSLLRVRRRAAPAAAERQAFVALTRTSPVATRMDPRTVED